MTTSLTDNGVQFADGSLLGAIPRSFLAGLTLSTAGASATMSIAAGQTTDSTNAVAMTLAAIAKTTAAWAVGTAAGGLDTGAIAANTWYHFFVIRRPDTGVVDVLFSLSATAPTLPASYTQFRRIGSARTNGSSQWTAFSQFGDEFLWSSAVNDFNGSVPVSPTLTTISTPLGIKTRAIIQGYTQATAGAVQTDIYSPDGAASVFGGVYSITSAASVYASLTGGPVRTNTASQIYLYANASGVTANFTTGGWIDTRGRDA